MTYKIVHLTSVHKPNDTRIFIKECKTLQKKFGEVILIAPHDKNEVIDGIKIYPVPKPKNRKERMLKTIWRVYKYALSLNADIYHFHDPELIPIGLLLKARGKKVIYDVHEDVPKQILNKYWIPAYLRKIVSELTALLEKISANVFDGIVAATPSIAKRFPDKKTVVVQNFPIINELVSEKHIEYGQRPNNIVYIGGIAEIRGIKEMVQAVEFLPDYLNAKLVLAGNFTPPSLEEKIKNLSGWKYVEFKGWVSRREASYLLGSARVGLVLFHPVPNHIEAQPNKLFEYMSAGIPVVASDFPLWREIIKDADCGILVDPLNPEAIADAIKWLLEHPKDAEEMGRKGREAIIKKYNWESEAKKLIIFYEKLLMRGSQK
ncbi:MAG: hypothetical protein PWP45_1281 [Tepidanaerobacteraceae bacterium]|nr:hypothetical protein [Tepidanaerobacteraceae bacterium]